MLPITPAAYAKQSIANSISLKKPEEWPPCLVNKLRHSKRVSLVDSEQNIQNKYLHMFNSLITKDI